MWIFGAIVEFLFWILIDLIGYAVARVVLPLASFGRIHVAPFDCSEGEFSWFGGRRDGFGRLEIGPTVAAYVGLAILVAFLCCARYFVVHVTM